MDEFFEVERLTRDPDPDVRATAHAYLPIPNDESLAVSAHLPGLRDDSDTVVAVAAQRLEMLGAREALPELIDYLRAKRATGTFIGEEVAVGNVAAKIAGLKTRFEQQEPMMCGTAAVWMGMERDRPFLRTWRAAHSFARSVRGDWDDGLMIMPAPFTPVEPSQIADDFAARDQLLAWWETHGKHFTHSLSAARSSRKVLNSSQ
jgi:hypothetical protein